VFHREKSHIIMTQSPFIVCDNLVKIYQEADVETVALQGLDFVASKGELLGMVGVSGSGKSTLMNILGGLDRPSAGRVWVDGIDLLGMSDAALTEYRRSKVGFVWQQGSRNLVPYLNVMENIELPMMLAGKVGKSSRAWAEELLDAVDLTQRRTHRLGELSGGEQQRVAIAVALANNPAFLLADEPTGELDSVTALSIYETFQKLNREYAMTTLIVSHDPEIAQHVGRVVTIHDGRLASETVRQQRDDPSAEKAAESFEELTILDAAGRLRIPQQYLEKFSIKGRARLELTEEGILIRPAPNSEYVEDAEILVDDMIRSRQPGRIRQLWQKWSKRTGDGE
jgi:putative ABC transport system ATP-binding protein